MKLSTQLSRRCLPVCLDWNFSATRDAFLLFGAGMTLFAFAHFYDLPPHLLQFGLDHADWKVDDAIFVIFMLSAASIVYWFRRYRDLSAEINARMSTEVEARKLARHDPLTGLPNRRFFEEQLEQYLGIASDTAQVAVLMLDLDGFKTVNDTHGHAAGDKALNEFARRVSVVVRADAFLARVGGNEFAIIMPAIGSLDDPSNLARRIAAASAEPYVVESVTTDFRAGIGIATAPNDGGHADQLVKRADRTLCCAKAAGRSSIRLFEPEWTRRSSGASRSSENSEARSRPIALSRITSLWCRWTAIASSGLRHWHVGRMAIQVSFPPTCSFSLPRKPVLSMLSETSFSAGPALMPTPGQQTKSLP